MNGNGAIIDLHNQTGLWGYSDIYSDATLDIQYCSIINGAYESVIYSGDAMGNIRNSNFINNMCQLLGLDKKDLMFFFLKFPQNNPQFYYKTGLLLLYILMKKLF